MSSSIKLNLDAKPFIPSKSNYQSTLLPPAQHTSLSLNAKKFIPKSMKKNMATASTQPQPQPQVEKPKPKKIDREYFVIDESDTTQYNFDFDYMISFENWEICKETKLLSSEFLKHLEEFNIVENVQIKQNNMNNKGKKKYGDKRNKENEKKKRKC